MLPHNAARRPSAINMACSIDVVVVLPFVPVTTSHCRGDPKQPAASSRHANSTSPQIGTPAAAAAASTGAVGGKPGLVITRSYSSIRDIASAGATVAPPRSASCASDFALSSHTVTARFHIAESARRIVEVYNEVNCCEPADAVT